MVMQRIICDLKWWCQKAPQCECDVKCGIWNTLEISTWSCPNAVLPVRFQFYVPKVHCMLLIFGHLHLSHSHKCFSCGELIAVRHDFFALLDLLDSYINWSYPMIASWLLLYQLKCYLFLSWCFLLNSIRISKFSWLSSKNGCGTCWHSSRWLVPSIIDDWIFFSDRISHAWIIWVAIIFNSFYIFIPSCGVFWDIWGCVACESYILVCLVMLLSHLLPL